MKKSKLALYSLVHSIGVLGYIYLVALVMKNGDKIFGKVNDIVSIMGFLMLFVLSAAIVGGLVLGKPIMLYLDKDRKEAVKLFIMTLGWLLILLIVVFAVMAMF